MKLEGQEILCFAPSDWWGMNPSCTTHIMRRLAGANRILYINPFSSDLLGVSKGKRKGFSQRLVRKAKSLSRWLRKPQAGLSVFSPLFIPIQGKRFADAVNNRLLLGQIRAACRLSGLQHPILWLENIRAADLLPFFPNALKIYHVSDLFSQDGYVANRSIQQQREARITQEADLIICVSKQLYELKKAQKDNVFYLPHGVDYDLFYRASEEQAVWEPLRHIPRPIAGYFGTLTDSNDIALWEYCARQMPDVSFVLAGRITAGDYSKLASMRNVHLTGFLPYEVIPSLCAGFDVCMLNWKQSPWIYACNPLKAFEYMAAGKPIVSVPIRELEQYQDVVSIARTPEEYVHFLRRELQSDTPLRKQRRREIAQSHDWDIHLSRLAEILNPFLVKRGG
jgi:glycosyltransferase involved in cell wall biosynthesis